MARAGFNFSSVAGQERSDLAWCRTTLVLMQILIFLFFSQSVDAHASEENISFHIKGFIVTGNTLLPEYPLEDDPESPLNSFPTIQTELENFIGPDKAVEDIERARSSLENTYHKIGYPTVLVNIPEQTMEDGFVRLEVVESIIRRVRITGNRFFTMENVLADLPSLREGEILYLPHLQAELLIANRNPDYRVEPVLMPGKRFGTVDVELRVKDAMPLHGSLELNNRASVNTTDLRLNGHVSYDNLWQKEHSVSLQFQTSPQDFDESQVVAGSYVLPTPWNDDHRLAFFSIWSDSQTAFGEGFQTIGQGYILGARYVMPLAPYELYTHNATVGIDYKNFKEDLFAVENLRTPITYLPFIIQYNGTLPDESGQTNFIASLNTAFRGLLSDRNEFATKRFLARENYIYLNIGFERAQKLPWDTSLFFKIDGRIADQPLISNEQYTAGGLESVRGYKESAAAGDNAFHSTIEYSGPDLADIFNISERGDAFPYIFYDMANLHVIHALPGQDANIFIQGTGLGFRGRFTDTFDYNFGWAIALNSFGTTTDSGDQSLYFTLKSKF